MVAAFFAGIIGFMDNVPTNQATTIAALRGATTVSPHTPEAYQAALIELLSQLLETNHLAPENIIAVWFTVTPDLTCDNPARIARTALPGWANVPMLCAAEPNIPGYPSHCVRVMVQGVWPTGNLPTAPFLYLGNCSNLRGAK